MLLPAGDYVAGRLQIDLRSIGVEDVGEDRVEILVLRHLRHQQAREFFAHDEVVGLRDLRELAIPYVEHLRDDRIAVHAAFHFDVAQMQQRDERLRIGLLHRQPLRVAEDDDVLEALRVDRLERRAVGRVGGAVLDGVASQGRAQFLDRFGDAVPFGDHHQRRAGCRIVVQLADDDRRARVPAEEQRALGSVGGGRAIGEQRGVDARRRLLHLYRLEILRDHDRGISRSECLRHRRGELPHSTARLDADQRGGGERRQRVGERESVESRVVLEIDLVAAVVEQLGVHGRESGLAARLRDDARDHIAGIDQLRFVASDQPRGLEILAIVNLRDDVELLRPSLRMIRDREDRLDHFAVRILFFRREHDDRARGVEVHDLQIAEIDRTSAPAHDSRRLEIVDALADLVLPLPLVAIGHDHDAVSLSVLVAENQLLHDREDLRVPSENHDVAALGDHRTPLAQLVDLVADAVADQADERADDEDAAQRHAQHEQEIDGGSGVAAHRSRVERAHQVVPHQLRERQMRAVLGLGRAAGDHKEHRRDGDEDDRRERQPGDERGRTAGKRVVERVAKALPKRELFHRNSFGPSPVLYRNPAEAGVLRFARLKRRPAPGVDFPDPAIRRVDVSTPETLTRTQFTRESIIEDYRVAVRSRQASLLGRKEVLTGKAKFGIFGDGKEIPQLAWARAFRKGDWRSGYYRDQTLMLALNAGTLEEFFAQLYADADVEHDPWSGGRSMNAHFATRLLEPDGSWKRQTDAYNISADVSPTGSQMPRLVGLAWASKLYRDLGIDAENIFSRNGDEIAWGSIGNASCAEGMFWESLNAAGVLGIPMIVSIWDDGYGISVPNEFQITKSNLSELLKGFQREPFTRGGQRAAGSAQEKSLPAARYPLPASPGGFDIYSVKGWDYAA